MKMTFIPPKPYATIIKNLLISIYCFIAILLVGVFFLSDNYKAWAGKIEQGTASWYSENEELDVRAKWGGYTKNGEKFDDTKMTCAMPKVEQLNKWYLVTNINNGKSVKVWANDTGSFKKLGRVVDLSKSAFAKIADLDKGLISVKVVDLSK